MDQPARNDETPRLEEWLAAPPGKHSVIISGHATSVTVEPVFWGMLNAISKQKGVSLNALITEIDSMREKNTLSSAIRLYVVYFLATK